MNFIENHVSSIARLSDSELLQAIDELSLSMVHDDAVLRRLHREYDVEVAFTTFLVITTPHLVRELKKRYLKLLEKG